MKNVWEGTLFGAVKIALGLDPNEPLPEENEKMSTDEFVKAVEILEKLLE